MTGVSSARTGREISDLPRLAMPLFVSALGTFIAMLPSNPNNMTLPSRDSGVFLYVAWRWLGGDIPYRDVWDHKPPLIYLVDVLGISFTPASLWGVWLIQVIFIFLTFWLLFDLLKEAFGRLAALGGVIILASGLLTILERGNVTEEYALLFQVLGIVIFLRAQKADFPIRTSFWMGLCGGIAFNFKQTTIGIWIAYALILFAICLSQRRNPLRDFLSLFAGWLLPSILIVLYFASQRALGDFWEQAYLYNFVYIGKHEGLRRLIPVFAKGFLYLQNGWILHFIVLGWLAALGYFWLKWKSIFTEVHPLVLIALLDLPIEVILITISGRSILHYYLTLLPVAAILTGSLIHTVPLILAKMRFPFYEKEKVKRWLPAMLLTTIVLAQIGQAKYYPEYVRTLAANDYTPVIRYLSKNTNKDDQVLIIGAESVINFLAQREAPTRYVYQYPLALLGRRPMFEEYFNQILTNKPVLIIDTRGRSSLTEKLYEPLQKRSPIVRAGVKYLGENYQHAAQFGDWVVYKLAEQ
jgi:hypothetical protein